MLCSHLSAVLRRELTFATVLPFEIREKDKDCFAF